MALGETKLKDKHTGIVKTVTDAKSYVTPALITDDAIYMEGRFVSHLMIHFKKTKHTYILGVRKITD
ncbi:hypothetical protein [Staphylococcus pseudintermedius]|uniref:hypothetical protein n=1 Tax=Staphylococcus pseudintermedius TaxID=283734 RepID=UPI001F110F86|nr:hypothetical protein [Staphylococcus pseudintermedius]